MGLVCSSEKIPGGCLLRVSGAVDALALPHLDKEFERLNADRHGLVVLDLSNMTFIGSLGMGSLLNLRKASAVHGGTVRLAAPQPLVADALRRVRLHEVFDIHDTVASAIASS